jgi:hypothetical protein
MMMGASPAAGSSGFLPPLPQFASSSSADSNAIALAQAFQTRVAALSGVAANLLGKREALAHQLSRVTARLGEVAAARAGIEAHTLADAEAVLHRLRAAEAGKAAALERDADVLAGDIAAIDAFYAALTRFQPSLAGGEGVPAGELGGAGGVGMGMGATSSTSAAAPAAASSPPSAVYNAPLALEFMRAYPELCAQADRLGAKAIKGEVRHGGGGWWRRVCGPGERSPLRLAWQAGERACNRGGNCLGRARQAVAVADKDKWASRVVQW